MSEEVEYLREYLNEICQYKGLQEELTYDAPLEILKRTCIALDYLQQENNQLKERIKQLDDGFMACVEEKCEIAEELNKYKIKPNKKEFIYNIKELQQKRDLYKEVIEEVREYIKHEWFKREQIGIMDKSFQVWELDNLLQILDKVKGEVNE